MDTRALAQPHSRFATVLGLELHHTVEGPPDAPAVLLSHHFYGSAPTWRRVQTLLAARRRTIAWDRPGFGLTERPPRSRWNGRNPYTRDAAATLGWGLLDHLGVGAATLVGSSAGGTNVLEMYARQPRRVRALVLLSPAITGDVGAPSALRPLLRSAPARWVGRRLARRLAGGVDPARISRGWHDPGRATEQDAAPYRTMLQVDGWDAAIWELLTAERPPDLRPLVRRIDVPTLVVTGGSDRVISPRWNRRTAAAIPHATYVELPGVGHTPQEEAPEQLARVVGEFLARVGA